MEDRLSIIFAYMDDYENAMQEATYRANGNREDLIKIAKSKRTIMQAAVTELVVDLKITESKLKEERESRWQITKYKD